MQMQILTQKNLINTEIEQKPNKIEKRKSSNLTSLKTWRKPKTNLENMYKHKLNKETY